MCGLFFLLPGLVLLADCTRKTIEERPSISTGGMMDTQTSAYIQPSQSIRKQTTSVADIISLLKMVKEAGRVRGVGPNVRKESLPSSPFNPFGGSVVKAKRVQNNSGPFVRDPNCNSSQLREILIQSITCSSFESKQRINAAIERNLEGSFSIICAECAFSYLAHTIQYCRHSSANVTCLVFRDDDPREIRNL